MELKAINVSLLQLQY